MTPEDRSAERPPGGDEGAGSPVRDVRLTDTQRQILAALCRPRAEGNRYATPATNQEIAAAVYLSVDAVKAHLRALYRKFGIEPLPHNLKRARLVELVLEGDLLSEGVPPPPSPGEPGPRSAPEPPSPPVPVRKRSWWRSALVGAVLAAAVAAVAFALFGVPGDQPEESLSEADYRDAVNEYCELAIGGEGRRAGGGTAERAAAYLSVIETMRGRLESLSPPPGSDRALERFSSGLQRAADFTSMVAQRPPPPGSRANAHSVAELTIAAGQVQAGAVGLDLGPDCIAIGDLVADSARNAARAP